MEILKKPSMVCKNCQCQFTYDKSDVSIGTKQVWTGFFNGNGLDGGWKWREYNYLVCPGCATKIIL